MLFAVNRCGPFDVIERSELVAMDNTVAGFAVIKCDKSSSFESGQLTNSFRCLADLSWEQHGLCMSKTLVLQCFSFRYLHWRKLQTFYFPFFSHIKYWFSKTLCV